MARAVRTQSCPMVSTTDERVIRATTARNATDSAIEGSSIPER